MWAISGQNEQEYGPRHAAYGLTKIRAKDLVAKVGSFRHYQTLCRASGPSPLCWFFERRLFNTSWPALLHPDGAANLRTAAVLTNNMNPFAPTCEVYSRNWESPHSQILADVSAQGPAATCKKRA